MQWFQMGIAAETKRGVLHNRAVQHVFTRSAAISFVRGNQGQYQGLMGSH
jgi:hypothetical protein